MELIEKAITELISWYKLSEKVPHKQLYCKTKGIIHHDRILNGGYTSHRVNSIHLFR